MKKRPPVERHVAHPLVDRASDVGGDEHRRHRRVGERRGPGDRRAEAAPTRLLDGCHPLHVVGAVGDDRRRAGDTASVDATDEHAHCPAGAAPRGATCACGFHGCSASSGKPSTSTRSYSASSSGVVTSTTSSPPGTRRRVAAGHAQHQRRVAADREVGKVGRPRAEQRVRRRPRRLRRTRPRRRGSGRRVPA